MKGANKDKSFETDSTSEAPSEEQGNQKNSHKNVEKVLNSPTENVAHSSKKLSPGSSAKEADTPSIIGAASKLAQNSLESENQAESQREQSSGTGGVKKDPKSENSTQVSQDKEMKEKAKNDLNILNKLASKYINKADKAKNINKVDKVGMDQRVLGTYNIRIQLVAPKQTSKVTTRCDLNCRARVNYKLTRNTFENTRKSNAQAVTELKTGVILTAPLLKQLRKIEFSKINGMGISMQNMTLSDNRLLML